MYAAAFQLSVSGLGHCGLYSKPWLNSCSLRLGAGTLVSNIQSLSLKSGWNAFPLSSLVQRAGPPKAGPCLTRTYTSMQDGNADTSLAEKTADNSSSAKVSIQIETKLQAEKYLRSIGYKKEQPVVLYDGVCNLCNTGVNFVLAIDKNRLFRYAALQSNAGRSFLLLSDRQPDDLSTMVVVQHSKVYIKSDAMLIIGKLLQPLPIRWLSILAEFFIPRTVRDFLYMNVLSKNRYNYFGRRDVCRLTNEGDEHLFLQ